MPKIACPHCGKRIADTKVRCPFCRTDISTEDDDMRQGFQQPVKGFNQAEVVDENSKIENPAITAINNDLTDRLSRHESQKNMAKIESKEEKTSSPPPSNNGSKSEEVFDWKQLQRYILNSKPFEVNGTYNNYTILLLDKLQLPKDEKNLLLFANDCKYLFTVRPNLHLGVRNSLLKKYEESILRLEQIAPLNPEIPIIKIHFQSVSKFGVKNIISFLK